MTSPGVSTDQKSAAANIWEDCGKRAIPMAASMNQKSATATSAAVIPVRYEMATNFPFFITFLLVVKYHAWQCYGL